MAPWEVQVFKALSHADIIQLVGALGPSYMHDGVGALFGSARSGKKTGAVYAIRANKLSEERLMHQEGVTNPTAKTAYVSPKSVYTAP